MHPSGTQLLRRGLLGGERAVGSCAASPFKAVPRDHPMVAAAPELWRKLIPKAPEAVRPEQDVEWVCHFVIKW